MQVLPMVPKEVRLGMVAMTTEELQRIADAPDFYPMDPYRCLLARAAKCDDPRKELDPFIALRKRQKEAVGHHEYNRWIPLSEYVFMQWGGNFKLSLPKTQAIRSLAREIIASRSIEEMPRIEHSKAHQVVSVILLSLMFLL